MLNKAGESDRPELVPPAEHQLELAALHDRLASRDAACAQLSSQQVKLAEIIERQARQLTELKSTLAAAEASVVTRYEETAKLTRKLVAQEEESETIRKALAQTRQELATSRTAFQQQARKHARKSALVEHAMAVRADSRRLLERSLAAHRQYAAACQAQLEQVRSGLAWKLLKLLRRIDPGTPPPPAADVIADHTEQQVAFLKESKLFDAAWYLAHYPEAGNSGLPPVRHYLSHGAEAGYDPGPAFDTTAYLIRYPDVRHSGMNPLVHYIAYGRAEGRSPLPLQNDD